MQRFISDWEPAPRRTGPEETLFAIGDVHGCTAQLDVLLGMVREAIAAAGDRRCALVMLGDYVDRGPDSIGAVRRIAGLQREFGIPVTALRGNHDQYLIDAMGRSHDRRDFGIWLWNGGGTTLDELGVSSGAVELVEPALTARQIRAALGSELVAFLDRLELYKRFGDYLFVHAGVHPQRTVEMHEPEELMWIREPFLAGRGWRHPYAVVHGHTPIGPEVRDHRIGVDSGCFRTGVLTAVELKDGLMRLHLATDARGLAELPSSEARRFAPAPRA
ncbi:MAG: metallophosphoesterase [Geminicoccaceae bacterium]